MTVRRPPKAESGPSEYSDKTEIDLVFNNGAGNPLDESRVRKRFARAMKRAGVSGHRLYDLRHTFASSLLAKGAPITHVAAQLGHAKATTTLQHYARWLQTESVRFVDRLDSGTEPFWHPWHQRLGEAPIPDLKKAANMKENLRAPSETRTPDPLIKSCTSRRPPTFLEE